MNLFRILPICAAILFLSSFSFSQVNFPSIESGSISRNASSGPCPSGNVSRFTYLGSRTNIHGFADPNFSGAMLSECYVNDCCNYGVGFKMRDVFIGNNNMRPDGTPITVAGDDYPTFFYRGSLQTNGIIRIPFHARKKGRLTLTGEARVSGGIRAYLTLIDVTLNNPFYADTFLDPKAKVTITIEPRGGDPKRFDVVELKYDFINTQ